MGDDKTMIVLARGPLDRHAVPGSTEVAAGCGHDCIISPSSRRALAQGQADDTVCMDCAGFDSLDTASLLSRGTPGLAEGCESEIAAILGPKEASRLTSAQAWASAMSMTGSEFIELLRREQLNRS